LLDTRLEEERSNLHPPGNDADDRQDNDQRRNKCDALASLHRFGIPFNPIDLDPQEGKLHDDFVTDPPVLAQFAGNFEIAAWIPGFAPLFGKTLFEDLHDPVGFVKTDQKIGNVNKIDAAKRSSTNSPPVN